MYHLCRKDIKWNFIVFFSQYNGSEIKNMEFDKCLEYRFFKFFETQNSELVTERCKYLINTLKEITK